MSLKVMMPMRDGVRLATDIYRPKTDKLNHFLQNNLLIWHSLGEW
ncbi:MAG: hypothetical protein R2822_07805 [Spirosomataceae bacterium]